MEEQLDNIPRHVAIIMDGNGRWAKKRGSIRLSGHKAGAETLLRVLNYCEKYKVQYLSVYAFSTENWSRPKAEVDGLMSLLGNFLRNREEELIEAKCRFRVMGRKEGLSESLQKLISKVEASTKGFERQLIVCLNYGGRAELLDAAKKLAEDAARGDIDPQSLTEEKFGSYLYLPDVPDPDLIIRTSGEFRLSNFLLWEAAYSELYVIPVLWPDFSEEDFLLALKNFAKRTRKFGAITEDTTNK